MRTAKPVLVTTSSFCAGDIGPKKALIEAGLEVFENSLRRKLSEEEVLGLLARHKPLGMIAGIEPLTQRVLEAAAAHLRVISRCGIGLDSVDLPAARRLGMLVFNTPDAPSQAVAELTVALMLGVLRRVSEADRAMRRGEWTPLMGRLLGGARVGVVGLGRIGSRVTLLLQAFGVRVLGCDPRTDLPALQGVRRVSLDELLAESDIVTLHLPMSPENRRLICAERISRMRKGAVLINASRGGLIDENALAEALKSGRLAGAGLDAYEEEPYRGPLKDLPQVVLTSHMGAAAHECRTRMEREAADNLISGLRSLGVL